MPIVLFYFLEIQGIYSIFECLSIAVSGRDKYTKEGLMREAEIFQYPQFSWLTGLRKILTVLVMNQSPYKIQKANLSKERPVCVQWEILASCLCTTYWPIGLFLCPLREETENWSVRKAGLACRPTRRSCGRVSEHRNGLFSGEMSHAFESSD